MKNNNSDQLKDSNKVTLVLPSKGSLEKVTISFLERCGLSVFKPNPRQYTASIPSLPEITVLFQRVEDIVTKVADGSADLGISGYDIISEYGVEDSDLIVIHPKLGYGYCEIVIAVPQSWVDVDTMADLNEISLDFREKRKQNIRIATKFPTLTKNFLLKHNITHFTIIEAQGAIEAAPTLGYADIVADITSTGTTLRENHLKLLEDGTIIQSQACLIGNKNALLKNRQLLKTLKSFLEMIDASIAGKNYYKINAMLPGNSEDDVALMLLKHSSTRGTEGPSVAPVYAMKDGKVVKGGWFTATIIMKKDNLLETIDHFRKAGATQIIVTPARYIVFSQSQTYKNLLQRLKRG